MWTVLTPTSCNAWRAGDHSRPANFFFKDALDIRREIRRRQGVDTLNKARRVHVPAGLILRCSRRLRSLTRYPRHVRFNRPERTHAPGRCRFWNIIKHSSPCASAGQRRRTCGNVICPFRIRHRLDHRRTIRRAAATRQRCLPCWVNDLLNHFHTRARAAEFRG